MRVTYGFVAVLAVALGSAVLGATAARQGPPTPKLPAALPADDAALPVLLVELTFNDGHRLTGKLAKEDDQSVSVTTLSGSTVAYPRSTLKDVQKYTMPAAGYAEQVGDYLSRGLWRAEDPPDTYVKAREQYQTALTLSPAAKDHQRLVEKMEALEKERDAYQTEMVRRSDVKKAQDQAELTRLETEVARQKLSTLRDHEVRLQQQETQLRQLAVALSALQQQADATDTTVDDLDINLTQLSQDLDDLAAEAETYVTQASFDDLRKLYDALKADVQRLQRALGII